MKDLELHRAEGSILYTLRHQDMARFTELKNPTGLEGDSFKFHLSKLVKLALVEKLASGHYHLTTKGKELANNLDKNRRSIQKQPKLSLILVVTQENGGSSRYLIQERRRHPFYGFYGFISCPVVWGEEFEETANKELLKQTGLSAYFSVASTMRAQDYSEASGELLEDKVSIILTTKNVTGEIINSWEGGYSAWLTRSEIALQQNRFQDTDDIIVHIKSNTSYFSRRRQYTEKQY